MAVSKVTALLLLSSLASASVPVARAESSAAASSSGAAAAAATCWTYSLPATLTAEDTEQNDDSTSTSTRRRRAHGEITHLNHFERRGRDFVSEFGTCQLGAKIYKPQYPRSSTIEQDQAKQGWEFLGYFVPQLDQCAAAATYTAIADASDVPDTTAAYWENVAGGVRQKYLPLGSKITTTNAQEPHINIEHVFELKILDQFMVAMLDEYKFCDDFKTWFLTIDNSWTNPSNKHVSRLQRLYSFLPGNVYPDVIAEDSRLNSYKGPMFMDDKLTGLPTASGTGDDAQTSALSIINTMAVVVDMLRDSKIAGLFAATNTRLYKAFLGIDKLMESECGAKPQPKDGWANAYSSWAEEFVQSQANVVSTRISQQSAKVTSTEVAGVKNVYGNALDAFNAAYPTASWKWDTSMLLDWSAKDGYSFAKRGESSAAVCTPTASSSAAVSHSHSVTPTHTASTAVETGSRSTHISSTHSSKTPEVTSTTHTSTPKETETRSHSSGSAEVKHSSSTKVVDTETAPTSSSTMVTSVKTTSSEVKEMTTTAPAKESTTTTPAKETTSTTAKETTSTTSKENTTSTTSTTTTSTTSTTSKESTTTTSEKQTTTSEAKETDKTTTTKEEEKTKTTEKSTEETKGSSSTCKKKKCKKGKCTCVD
ncbi:hypothetical protein BO71DRAFT_389114 [Aspergillus ellipticus CBS 707.79]|uniref:Uncharacterized protein n=1 Tax=Aspergillus ellipticus CBS 707.79 TaxID=1448320 RepID=A0A319CYN0_9EURO|nr:hypothetical protein BO71DRAFT_389114 [Aspergillus ellipticus CBS 707.79]